MGYDIHITRAESWENNKGQEITEREWLALVANDAELELDPQHGECAVCWRGTESPPEAWFDWFAGNIYTTNPDRRLLSKALRIAAVLDAMVQGDDGRIYMSTDDWVQIPTS